MEKKENNYPKKPNETIQVTDTNFNTILNKNPNVLIDFYADWCRPCKLVAPKIEELSKKYFGKVLVGQIDIDKNPKTTKRFSVRSIPTLLFLKNGKEVNRIIGTAQKLTIEKTLKQAFNFEPEGD